MTPNEIICENTTRKIDALGRIGVPKGIRNRLRLDVNQEMDFFTMRGADGKDYVLFAPVEELSEAEKYARVIDLMNNLGLEVPVDFLAKVEVEEEVEG